MSAPNAAPNTALSSAQHDYRIACQNFQGLLGKLRRAALQRARQALGTDPSHVASYALTAGVQSAPPPTITSTPQLSQVTHLLLTRLTDLIHQQLSAAEPTYDPPSFQLVVGLSGGADSVLVLVLAAQLQARYGYQVQAVHCIHGLDPDDAIWREHNEALCAQLKVPLSMPQLNIVYGGGVSPEDASRQERYRALLTQMARARHAGLGCALLLGHQADDQIESLILALKRGSGPVGLAGMQFLVRDQRGLILRPLLNLHKHEVETILKVLDIPYVYDLSNSYLKFERNFVRLKVLPLLKERFPGVEGALLRTQQLCRYEHELAQRLVQDKLHQLCPDPYTLDFAALDLSDRALTTILVRTFITQATGTACEFNIVEQALELMAAGHDRNGLVKIGSGLVLSTFLHYLCLYSPLGPQDLSALSGSYELSAHDALELGPYRYELVAENTPPQGNELHCQQAAEPYFALDNAPAALAASATPVAHSAPVVCLDFSYARSLPVKLKGRAHARPLKKLMIAAAIAPWLRPALPLVKAQSGTLLAVGLLGAVAPPAEPAPPTEGSVTEDCPRYALRISRITQRAP